MTLQDYQMSFNGYVFGAGTDVGISDITGLFDLMTSSGDTPVPRESGDIPGLVRGVSREIILELQAKGPERSEELATTLNDALAAFAVSQTPAELVFKDPGFDEVQVYARPIGRIIPMTVTLTKTMRPFTVRLKAPDPRIYSTNQKLSSMNIYSASGGGMDYDVTDYSKEFAFDSSASTVLHNAGNSAAYPLIQIYGPTDAGTLTAVTITNITTGQTAEFTFTTGLVASDIFSVDMRRIVTADPGEPFIDHSGTNRYGDWDLPRTPFALIPGDNELRYETTGTTSESVCVLSWRDTSL